MNEPSKPASSAGAIIRAAREQQGVSLSQLSILLKIPERRLQLFEADQWEQLGDATFIRVLALSLCRRLQLDPASVMPLLPTHRHEPSSPTQIADLHSHHTSSTRSAGRALGRLSGLSAVTWGVLLILALAVALALMPEDWVLLTPQAVTPELASPEPAASEPAPADAAAATLPNAASDTAVDPVPAAASGAPTSPPAPRPEGTSGSDPQSK